MLTIEIPTHEYNRLVQGAQQLLAKRNSEIIKYEQEIEKYNKNIPVWKFWKRVHDSSKYDLLPWFKNFDAFDKIRIPNNLNIELCKLRIYMPEMLPWGYKGDVNIGVSEYNKLINQMEILAKMRENSD